MAATLVPTTLAQEGVEINYWVMWNEGEPAAELIKDIAADYEAATGNTVNMTFAGREIITKLRTALSAGEQPDLVDFDAPSIFGGLVNNDLTMPLDDMLEEPAYGEDVAFKDIFIPGLLDQYRLEDGTVHFIPYEVITTSFWYDQRVFDDAGIEAQPTTWEEFIAVLDAIQETGYAPLTQDPSVYFYNLMWFYLLSARVNGVGALHEAASDPTGEAWDNPNWAKIIEMEQALWDGGYFIEGSEGFVWPAGQQELALGAAGIELVGSWLPNELKEITDPDFSWRTFGMPEVEGGEGTVADVESYLIGWVVMKDAPQPEATQEFIKFAMQEEYQTRLAYETILVAARAGIEPPPEMADVVEMFNNAEQLFPPYDNVNADFPDWYTNVLGKHHDDAFLGSITPEEFMERMKADTIEYWANQE
jgi:raffinose/stachyose/melibiose transport system substrate-binding protein